MKSFGHPDPKGFFSVKSAYILGRYLLEAGETSPSSRHHQEILWKYFWNTKIPSKIKHFGCKLYNNVFPTLVNLINPGIDINPTCFFCRDKMDTTEHLFGTASIRRGSGQFTFLLLIYSVWMTRMVRPHMTIVKRL